MGLPKDRLARIPTVSLSEQSLFEWRSFGISYLEVRLFRGVSPKLGYWASIAHEYGEKKKDHDRSPRMELLPNVFHHDHPVIPTDHQLQDLLENPPQKKLS